MTKHIKDDEKARLVLKVLARKSQPRLSLTELAARTGLTRGQAYAGWRRMRATLGAKIAVMEPHGAATVYYLSAEYLEGAPYLFWQTLHICTRLRSTANTVRDLSRATADDAVLAAALDDTRKLLDGAQVQARGTAAMLGRQIGVSDEELARKLAAA